MTAGTDRRAPVDLPGPDGDNSIAREPLWYAFGAGSDEPRAPSWTWVDEPPPDTHVAPPPPLAVRGGTRTPLPFGTVDLLERTSYPTGRVGGVSTVDEALGYALVTSFGVLRHEPDNPFNQHRCYASPRCLFPVQVIVDDGERWRMVEPHRHALVTLAGGSHRGHSHRLALTGRYTRIPRGYKWFRGSLVNLELGIALRSLCVGLELFGLSGRLLLPDDRSYDLLAELGLVPTWEWSLPLTVELDETPTAGPPTARLPEVATDGAPETALADLVRVNRAQSFAAPVAPVGSAIPTPAGPATGSPSWAELLWNRNSGRMPRGLHGMSGRRRQLPADVLRNTLHWLAVPPPGPTLRAVSEAATVTAVIQAVDGYPAGVYRVRDGEAVLHSADPVAAARLEAEYGYPLAPENGCDIRHASMIWFFSVRPRDIAARFGPGGWSAAQYVCGWATHGLCLAAAAAGLFARPVRAFKEIPTQRILGLASDEMIVIAVVTGVPRHVGGALLDLRL